MWTAGQSGFVLGVLCGQPVSLALFWGCYVDNWSIWLCFGGPMFWGCCVDSRSVWLCFGGAMWTAGQSGFVLGVLCGQPVSLALFWECYVDSQSVWLCYGGAMFWGCCVDSRSVWLCFGGAMWTAGQSGFVLGVLCGQPVCLACFGGAMWTASQSGFVFSFGTNASLEWLVKPERRGKPMKFSKHPSLPTRDEPCQCGLGPSFSFFLFVAHFPISSSGDGIERGKGGHEEWRRRMGPSGGKEEKDNTCGIGISSCVLDMDGGRQVEKKCLKRGSLDLIYNKECRPLNSIWSIITQSHDCTASSNSTCQTTILVCGSFELEQKSALLY